VAKRPGELVLSESFAAAGSGRYRAARVGREAYAARLTEEARRFTLASSELRAGIDRILYRPPRTGVPGIGRAAHDGILPP
jgi:cation-transporting ATPase E